MFNPTRQEVRLFFCQTLQKIEQNTPLTGAEVPAATVILDHPEYHSLMHQPQAIDREWSVAQGQMNPFLHLSLHLAIAEQLGINQPHGITDAYQQLLATNTAHAAQHIILECLAETIWQASRNTNPVPQSTPPFENYLKEIQRHLT